MHSLAAAPLQPAQSREDGWQGAEPVFTASVPLTHASQHAPPATHLTAKPLSQTLAQPRKKGCARRARRTSFLAAALPPRCHSRPPGMPTPPPRPNRRQRRQHRSTQPASALRHSLRLVAGAQVHTPAKGEGREPFLDAQAQARLRALECDGLRTVIL